MLKIFDAHVHIIDYKFPVTENRGFMPEEFLFEQYSSLLHEIHTHADKLHLIGGAIVSGSFQGDDQTYLEKLLPEIGETWVGVTQLPLEISDAEIYHLHEKGIRALRFNLARGPFTDLEMLCRQAHRVYDLVGWHAEIYVSASVLQEISANILALPRVGIDHLGLTLTGIDELYRLVDHGVRVKATGFGRLDLPIAEVLKNIYSRNPAALLFGTDLPGTRAPRRYLSSDTQLIIDTIDGEFGVGAADNIFYKNALDWYRIPSNSISTIS